MTDANPTRKTFSTPARLALAAIWIATILLPAASTAERRSVDRILGIINGQLITHSDVLAHTEILRRTRQSILPAREVLSAENEQALHRRVFREIAMRRIIFPEAVNLNLADVNEEEFRAECTRFLNTFESPEQYNRFCSLLGLREEQVVFLIRQRMACQGYVSKKIGLQIRIGLKPYYQEHRDEYPDLPFDQIRDVVAEDLNRILLTAWFEDVLSRADVRIVEASYEGALE